MIRTKRFFFTCSFILVKEIKADLNLKFIKILFTESYDVYTRNISFFYCLLSRPSRGVVSRINLRYLFKIFYEKNNLRNFNQTSVKNELVLIVTDVEFILTCSLISKNKM